MTGRMRLAIAREALREALRRFRCAVVGHVWFGSTKVYGDGHVVKSRLCGRCGREVVG